MGGQEGSGVEEMPESEGKASAGRNRPEDLALPLQSQAGPQDRQISGQRFRLSLDGQMATEARVGLG